MKSNVILSLCLAIPLSAGCASDPITYAGADAGGGAGDSVDASTVGGTPDATVVVDNRIKDGLQLLYRFDGAAGDAIVSDRSGVGDPYDLTILSPESVVWENPGLTFTAPTVAQNLAPLTKVYDACTASSAITVEAWVKNTVTDSQARIITMSQENNDNSRNFGLKQDNNADFEFRLRTSNNNNNGSDPDANSPTGTATIDVQHVVYVRDSVTTADFYLDGVKQTPSAISGTFANWDPNFGLYVGNEADLNTPYLGTIYLAAVYCRELKADEIRHNYQEGY